MKKYVHNYTKASQAENKIHEAYLKCEEESVKRLIGEALDSIREYLAEDNIVEDPEGDFVKVENSLESVVDGLIDFAGDEKVEFNGTRHGYAVKITVTKKDADE